MCLVGESIMLVTRRARSNRDYSIHCSGGGTPNKTLQLSSTEVPSLLCQFHDVHLIIHFLVLPQLGCVDIEDVNSSLFIR